MYKRYTQRAEGIISSVVSTVGSTNLFSLVDVGTSRQQELAAVREALLGCNVDGRLKPLEMKDIPFKHRSKKKLYLCLIN
jgi:hypothetical protein